MTTVADGEELQRRLTLRHVFAIALGAMFSSGFFLLPGIAADETGGSVFLAYLLAGFLVLPAMLSMSELSTAMPRAGGPYHFFQRSLGPLAAMVCGLGLWVANVVKAAFALVGTGAYLSLVVDVPIVVVGVGLAAFFTALNIVGARESASLQIGLVAVLLVVLALFSATGGVELAARGTGEMTETLSPFLTDGALGLLTATAVVFVSFAGLAQVASVAGEIREPARTIPRGLILAVAVGTAAYVVGTFLMAAALSPEELHDDTAPVATAVEQFPLPLGVPLVVLAALAAFASTANAGILSAARYPLAMARDRLLWSRFARLSRFGTPAPAVVVSGAAVAAVVALLDAESIAKVGSAVVLVVFALFNVAVIVLRSGRVPGYRPGWRSPGYPYVQIVGTVGSLALLLDLGALALGGVVAIVASGTVWYLVLGRRRSADQGVASHLFHRLRMSGHHPSNREELQRTLQEHGPRGDDRADEVFQAAEVVTLDPGASLEAVLDAGIERLASRLGADPARVSSWRGHRGDLHAEVEPGRAAVRQFLLDAAVAPELVVAWAPDAPAADGGRDGPGSEERRPDGEGGGEGIVAVMVLAGPSEEEDRLLRMSAMMAAQLGDDELQERWAQTEDADALRALLVSDVAQRQGGEPGRQA